MKLVQEGLHFLVKSPWDEGRTSCHLQLALEAIEVNVTAEGRVCALFEIMLMLISLFVEY